MKKNIAFIGRMIVAIVLILALYSVSLAEQTVEPMETMTPEEIEAYEAENSEISDEEDETVSAEERIQVDDLEVNEMLDDKGWLNILLLGADSRSLEDFDRTDSIIILSVNPETGKAKLTSIMRDTWVHIDGAGDKKINSANVYGGPQLVCKTINKNFGMNIEKYVLVNMRSLTTIIDMMGGIEIPELTEAELKYLNRSVKYDATVFKVNDASLLKSAGKNVHLTGNQALAYARIRHLDSDFKRVERQRNVLIAIATKLKKSNKLALISMIPIMMNNVATNLSIAEVTSLVTIGLGIDVNEIEQLRLPADGTYSAGTKNNKYRIECDFKKNEKILHKFIYE